MFDAPLAPMAGALALCAVVHAESTIIAKTGQNAVRSRMPILLKAAGSYRKPSCTETTDIDHPRRTVETCKTAQEIA